MAAPFIGVFYLFLRVLILWSFIYNAVLSEAPIDVDYFGVTTVDDARADSPGTLILTLWFNFNIYQFSVTSPAVHTQYFGYQSSSSNTPKYTWIGSYCDSNQLPEAKMMLQLDHNNAVQIDTIEVQTLSGAWYGVDTICKPLYPMEDDPWPWNKTYWGRGDDALCPSGYYNYEVMAVDNQLNDEGLGPYKQIIYFDTSLPNTYIKEASWSDATNPDIVPQPDTCDPSRNPTNIPSNNPTNLPSHNPTNSPFRPSSSKHPTVIIPTVAPSNTLTTEQTIAHTNSSNATNLPFHNPTDTTFHPSHILTTEQTIVHMNSSNAKPGQSNTYESTASDVSDNNAPTITLTIIALCALFAVVCALVIAILFLCYKKYRTLDVDSKQAQKHMTETQEVCDNASNKAQDAYLVKEWLTNTVALPLYADVFIKHGLDGMEAVKHIGDVSELEEMGIRCTAHQTLILSEIDNLRHTANPHQEEDNDATLVDIQPASVAHEDQSRSEGEVMIATTEGDNALLEPDEFIIETEEITMK